MTSPTGVLCAGRSLAQLPMSSDVRDLVRSMVSDDDDAERRASMPGMQPAQRPAATTCKRQAGRLRPLQEPERLTTGKAAGRALCRPFGSLTDRHRGRGVQRWSTLLAPTRRTTGLKVCTSVQCTQRFCDCPYSSLAPPMQTRPGRSEPPDLSLWTQQQPVKQPPGQPNKTYTESTHTGQDAE